MQQEVVQKTLVERKDGVMDNYVNDPIDPIGSFIVNIYTA